MKPMLVPGAVLLELTTFSVRVTCAGAETTGDPEFDAIDDCVEAVMPARPALPAVVPRTGVPPQNCHAEWYCVTRGAARAVRGAASRERVDHRFCVTAALPAHAVLDHVPAFGRDGLTD